MLYFRPNREQVNPRPETVHVAALKAAVGLKPNVRASEKRV